MTLGRLLIHHLAPSTVVDARAFYRHKSRWYYSCAWGRWLILWRRWVR